MLCPMPLILRDFFRTAGRPQKVVTRRHKEEPVRSLVDRFDRMSYADRGTIIGISGLLMCGAASAYLFAILPSVIDSVFDLIRSEINKK